MSLPVVATAQQAFLRETARRWCLEHRQSQHPQRNMMKPILRHYARMMLLPMLQVSMSLNVLSNASSLQADADMATLLNAMIFYRRKGVKQNKLSYVADT